MAQDETFAIDSSMLTVVGPPGEPAAAALDPEPVLSALALQGQYTINYPPTCIASATQAPVSFNSTSMEQNEES